MINIDMWHNDKIKAVEKINIFFNNLTGEYWGNCYINNKAIGDYTADSSTDIENHARIEKRVNEWIAN